MRELLRHRQMRVYLVGQGLSLFGSMSLWLAAGIFVKTLTDSYGAAGMAFFCVALGTLCGPLGGVLVDRFPRRPLLIATNTAAALLLAPLLLVREPNQVWLLYTVLFGYGALHGLIASGQSALLAGMLPTELLPHANSALRTIQEGLRLLAPLAGAGLVAWQGFYAVVWLDIAGFLAAAVTLLLIRPQEAVVT
ncbi:MAG: MFS transporter, partial [Micromonosporaceae bacterium]